MTVLSGLEQIDDDCDKHGIQFVKIDDDRTSRGYGIDRVPAIVYFEKQIPNIYSGDLLNEEEILHWLVSQLEKDEIEDVTDEILDSMIKEGSTLAVLFCKCWNYNAAMRESVRKSETDSYVIFFIWSWNNRIVISSSWDITF